VCWLGRARPRLAVSVARSEATALARQPLARQAPAGPHGQGAQTTLLRESGAESPCGVSSASARLLVRRLLAHSSMRRAVHACARATALALLGFTGAACAPLSWSGLDAERDSAAGKAQFESLLGKLSPGVPAASVDPATLWRRGRAKYDFATCKDGGMSADEAKKWLQEAFDDVVSAIERSEAGNPPELGAMYRWKGTILSGLTDYMSTKESIAASPNIRDAWTRAAELDGTDASAMHLLGRWYFKMASLSWVERTAAYVIFGPVPPATMEEALAQFERAETAQPGFWKANRYYLGECNARLGHSEEARHWFELASLMPVVTADDVEMQGKIEAAAKAHGWVLPSPGDAATSR
jgi:hypothetical protein